MKILSFCSYICSISALLFGLIAYYLILSEREDWSLLIWIFLLIMLPAIAQLMHTLRANAIYYLPVYKSTHSLDEFLLNDNSEFQRVRSTAFWQKITTVVNSLLLCCVFILMSYMLGTLISQSISVQTNFKDQLLLFTLWSIYMTALPTVFYNLRTFNLIRLEPSPLKS